MESLKIDLTEIVNLETSSEERFLDVIEKFVKDATLTEDVLKMLLKVAPTLKGIEKFQFIILALLRVWFYCSSNSSYQKIFLKQLDSLLHKLPFSDWPEQMSEKEVHTHLIPKMIETFESSCLKLRSLRSSHIERYNFHQFWTRTLS